ncbi:IS91 family transposase [bacterium]|nr:IS91 family transposase [bacterium]
MGSSAPARPSVLAIFRRHGEAYLAGRPWLSPEQRRLLRDVMVCRTAALGGHVYVCDSCEHRLPVYNSCRNRSCPNCQALDQARWIEARKARVLPVGHHHVVFTLPGQLRALAKRHPRKVFDLLMTSVRETLTVLPRDHLGLQLGVTAVLHTWTREMLFHPHVHCVVTAGGLSLDGARWVDRKGFLLPVALMKAFFRGRVLHHLGRLQDLGELELQPAAYKKLIGSLPKPKRWCIHIEQPFGRSAHVLDYLGRYTHRIAISDFRLVDVNDDSVRFRTRGDETTALSPEVFIDRYLQHVLPRGLHKIRHFGLYAAANVHKRLPVAQSLLAEVDRDHEAEPGPEPVAETAVELLLRLTGEDLLRCPKCQTGRMAQRPLPINGARGPPSWTS